MSEQASKAILVLGAYGLAGRSIVHRLLNETSYPVTAAGRRPESLQSVLASFTCDRLQKRVLDVNDKEALRKACSNASLVINAVGPYALMGAEIAKVVVECERPYIDCANEQIHYRALSEVGTQAQEMGLPLVTAAGVIPGISTLLIAHLLETFPETRKIDCFWAQARHAYASSGLASMMGGILEATQQPVALEAGEFVPVVMGRSTQSFPLPNPFGEKRLLELPTIDNLTIPKRYSLNSLHVWFYLGELPLWLLGLVRLLKPYGRRWAYRAIETIMRRINEKDTAKAIARGLGPEALLYVVASHKETKHKAQLLFKDGAGPTACLPVAVGQMILEGRCTQSGLLTPLDLLAFDEFFSQCEDVIVHSEGVPCISLD